MALISCPECDKQISDTALSCPHCGYVLSATAPSYPNSPTPTKIGDFRRHVADGIVSIVLGLFFVLIGIPFIGVFGLGIFSIIAGIFLFLMGVASASGGWKITCPHCGKSALLSKNTESFKCPHCKKRSVRDGDYLKPIL